ncbi:hypothetical protein [Geodermatophilus sp. SYSU D00710]
MSRPARSPSPAAAEARGALPTDEAAAFDRLASAVLAAPSAALGAVLRTRLPGVAGVRWLHAAGLSPTARADALTADQWLSLYRCWERDSAAPRRSAARGGALRGGGRPSAHGHAPGALAAPRWQ